MKTILVIEDEGSIINAVRNAINDMQWHIIYCTETSFETKRIIQQLPDIIIADITSLSSEKAGLLMHIKSKTAFTFVPLLLITSSSLSGSKKMNVQDLFNEGLIYCISKPFTNEELLEMIKKIIKQTETINPW